MTTTRYVISQALLSGLAGLLPGKKSPLSPLQVDNPAQLTPEQTLLLENTEILSDGNTLSEPARQILTGLSEVVSLARVRVNTPNAAIDQTVHFTAGGAQTVTLANTTEGMILSTPADVEAILAEVSDCIGAARRSPTPWSARLAPAEMQALVALLDLRRRAVLRALADQRPVVPPPSDCAAIAVEIAAMVGNTQWFTGAVPAPAPTSVQLQTSLNALVDKKLAWQHGDSFLPVPEAIQVADRLLLLNTFLSLGAGSCNSQGRSTRRHETWLGAGTGELLHLVPDQELLLLELTTPAAALEQIRTFLSHFDALPAPELDIVPLGVVIQNGISAGKTFDLGEETILGRSEQATIHLLDSRASRRHSLVRRLGEGYLLNDEGSTNGTFLNNRAVTVPTPLAEGDIILIGETQLKVVRAGFTPPPPVLENTPTVFVGDVLRQAGEMPPPPVPAAAPLKSEPAAPLLPLPPIVPPPVPAAGSFPPLPPIIPPPAPAAGSFPPLVPIQATPPAATPTPEPPARWFVPPPPPVKPAPVIPPPPALTPAPFEAPPSGARPPAPKPALCARCHEPLAPGDLVCTYCGQPVGQPVISTGPALPQTMAVCPKCFSPIDLNGRFCGTCGAKLS